MPMETRTDVSRFLAGILEPLSARYVPGGILCGKTGAHFSPRVALMEGWSRALWGISPLLAGGGDYADYGLHLDALRAGVNPQSAGYWGIPGDRDQRLVEMASIALALMLSPERYWEPLTSLERGMLVEWLSAIQVRELPANNWHFFRVLACLALRRLGAPVNARAESESFALIESCYRGDGWYIDGTNQEFDFYNPFAFHFYALVYARFADKNDPDAAARAVRYIERAWLFAPQFLNFFSPDGAVIPYGRSLTYRFAMISFFSACAFANVEALPWPVMKGLVMRNLRWWESQPIFDAAGLMTIGYAYPNLVMAEQYNSPGSPYWALKTFLLLALPENHAFWQSQEAPLPDLPAQAHLPTPGFVINRSSQDVQLLVPGRYPGWEGVNAAAKYSKFVYSIRFGFSVSHGSYALEKTGGDSSLLLSEGDGYWRERRHVRNVRSGPNWVSSLWNPWPDVEIHTTVIAMGLWHVRAHCIVTARVIETAEGGFSLPRYHELELPTAPEERAIPGEAFVAFPWGASRIVDLGESARKGELVKMEPNLNILYNSGVVPFLRQKLLPGTHLLACAACAGDADSVSAASIPPFEWKEEYGR